MKIICESGKRRSGKSTLAELLWKQYGYHPISLAGPLKKLVIEQFGMTAEQVDGDLKEVVDARYNKTPREILISVGQFYRSFDGNWWINKLLSEMYMLGKELYVIPDVRFKNELDALRPFGAFCVRLDRSEELTGKNIDDISETELDGYLDWDLHVPAAHNVDLKDLKQVAERIHVGIMAQR